jgi:hypothetical protein
MLSESLTAAVKIHPLSPLLFFDSSFGFGFRVRNCHVSNSWGSLTACELSSEYGDISSAAARGIHQNPKDFRESSGAIAQEKTDI